MEEQIEKIQIVSLVMKKDSELESQYGCKITGKEVAYEVISNFIGDKDREYLVVLNLDTKNNITSINTVSVGSLNSSIAHPREIFKTAILSNAASIILGHNHPSGDAKESREDIASTKRVKECGEILGIELLDHIIVGNGNKKYVSLREEGFI